MVPLVVKGKNIEVTESLRRYVESKFGKLDRTLDNITSLVVELSSEKRRKADHRQVVQATLVANGTILRAEEEAADMYAAIDLVRDKMTRQIKRYKEKLYHNPEIRRGRRASLPGATPTPMVESVAPEDAGTDTAKILRTKYFELKPMFPDEAVEQMELLGHDFFVFFNASNNMINVVYRRTSGGYGLLVPQPA